MAVVISLNWFMAPVDDTVTAQHKTQSHKKGRPGDKLEVRGECFPPEAGGTPQTPRKSFKLESLLWPNHGYIRTALVPRHGLGAWQTGLGAGRPGTEHSRIRSGLFLRKGIELSNTVS